MTEGGERDGSTDTADSVAEERFRGETRRFLEAALPGRGKRPGPMPAAWSGPVSTNASWPPPAWLG